jgi:hypothetical protein
MGTNERDLEWEEAARLFVDRIADCRCDHFDYCGYRHPEPTSLPDGSQ